MNFDATASSPQRIKWFFVDPSTPALGFPTPFVSRNWESDKSWPSVGEVYGASRSWRDGASPMPAWQPWGDPCGPRSAWAGTGSSPGGLLRNPNGVSLCCVGQLIGTVTIAWTPGPVLKRLHTPTVKIAWQPAALIPMGPTIAWRPASAGAVGPTIAWQPAYRPGLNLCIAWQPSSRPHPAGTGALCFDPGCVVLVQPVETVTIAWTPRMMAHPGGTGAICFDPGSTVLTQPPAPVTIVWQPGYSPHPGGDMAVCFYPGSRVLVEPPAGPTIAWSPGKVEEIELLPGRLELIGLAPTIAVTTLITVSAPGKLELLGLAAALAPDVVITPTAPGELDLIGLHPALSPDVVITPTAPGELDLLGVGGITVTNEITIEPAAPGRLDLIGLTPALGPDVVITPIAAGELDLIGLHPALSPDIVVTPAAPGEMDLIGLTPTVTDTPAGFGENRWYKFLEGSGVTLADSVSAQDGTVNGAAWDADSPTSGKSLFFSEGGGASVTIPHVTTVTDFTIFGRVKQPGSGDSFFQVLGIDNGSGSGWNLWAQRSGNQLWFIWTPSGGGHIFSCGSIDGTWHSFAASVSGTSITCYFDGNSVGTQTGSTDGDNPSQGYAMGIVNGSISHKGYLTDVRYWVSALDASTIAAVHANTMF